MIITKTPFRISFVGGGTDFESFYKHSQGAVLSATINKYMYISTHSFFDEDKVRVKYSKTETVKKITNLKHPIVKEVLKKFNIKGALEISSNADIPAGTGLGSSSAFTVGLLHNLYARSNKYVTKARLAAEACDIEINRLKEPIGRQDQYAVAHGGLNIIKFNPSGAIEVEPLHIKTSVHETLQKNLLIFYIGRKRKASYVLEDQKINILSQDKILILKEMVKLVWKLRDALYSGNLKEFGNLLHQNWLLKQQLSSRISNKRIDNIYKKARRAGALGGKILGAGGRGFLLLYCEKEKQKKIREALNGLKELQFKFEHEGSKVIYIEDEY